MWVWVGSFVRRFKMFLRILVKVLGVGNDGRLKFGIKRCFCRLEIFR